VDSPATLAENCTGVRSRDFGGLVPDNGPVRRAVCDDRNWRRRRRSSLLALWSGGL